MSAFTERMAALAVRFRARAAEDRDRIAEALATEDYATLVHVGHSLAGNAGLFGYPEVGDAAERVELAVEGDTPLEELRRLGGELVDLLDRIRATP